MALMSASPPAQADPVSYAFTGIFDVDANDVGLLDNKLFEGSFTYDPTIAPRNGAQAGAAQYDALIAFDLRVLDLPSAFSLRVLMTAGAPTAEVGIDEATNGAPSDAFKIFASSQTRGVIESPFSWDYFSVILQLERMLGSVFDDALSLPATLDLDDFDRTHLRLLLASPFATNPLIEDGRITSLRLIDTPPVGVPEPGTLELLTVAAGGLAAVMRRRQVARRRSPGHGTVPQADRPPAPFHPQTTGDTR